MTESLRALCRGLFGRRAARATHRPAFQPRCEALEERAVPTMDLTNYSFAMPDNVLLKVATETPATGAFAGTLFDVNSGLVIPITGQLTPLGGNSDTVTFKGVAGNFKEVEFVKYTGQLTEGFHPTLTGKLDEVCNFADYTAEVIYEGTSYGRLTPKPPPVLGPWSFPPIKLFNLDNAFSRGVFLFSPDGAPQQPGSFSPDGAWSLPGCDAALHHGKP
jgi:hypothetical protein